MGWQDAPVVEAPPKIAAGWQSAPIVGEASNAAAKWQDAPVVGQVSPTAPAVAPAAKPTRAPLVAEGAPTDEFSAMLSGAATQDSVLQNEIMPGPLPTEDRFVVNPEFVNAVQAQLNAMPQAKRGVALARMAERNDVYGRAARATQPAANRADDAHFQRGKPPRVRAAKIHFPQRDHQALCRRSIPGLPDQERARLPCHAQQRSLH